MIEQQQKISDFKTLAFAESLKLSKSHYFISLQNISQDDGSSSDHLVIKKQSMNEDGSPRGNSRQIFIAVADAEKVLKYAAEFLVKKAKN